MERILEIITKVVKDLFDLNTGVVLSRPEAKFGDLATNVALTLAGRLGKNPAASDGKAVAGRPREIAEQIAAELKNHDDFTSVEVAGAGFINMRLSDAYLTHELNTMLATPNDYGRPETYKNQIVVTEFSDPNPFKVLHVGHLYTSIVGDAISRLIELAGGEVHRVNFGGDVGMHVAKCIWGIITKLGGENPENLPTDLPIGERMQWVASSYVDGNKAYENDETKTEIADINKRIYQLFDMDEHDTPFARIYWTCRSWSYEYFDNFYDRIDVQFEKYYPESATAPLGLKTVQEQTKKSVFKESNGAIIFDGEPYGLHTRVFINSEGLPTYEAKDVGLSLTKWQDYHFDKSFIITGVDIIDYMKVVIKSIEQFEPELAARTEHITHGMMKLAGAVKMASRLGNFLKAEDVLDMVENYQKEAQGAINQDTVLGAVRYALLKNRLGPDIIFEPETSVNAQGNSGPYLQYSHARARSILRKIGFDKQNSLSENQDFDEYERPLLVKLTEWPEILTTAVDELAPHVICTYMYELAQIFNRFYENSRVEGDPRAGIRTCLVAAYADILRNGLGVLGIVAPEKM
ncbi:arginine--tRNA ligase [Candidatus Saccharibacteria bacterium]|nr:arginine--tRNA ligase [Candidatus Saccharibacteria bacterium]